MEIIQDLNVGLINQKEVLDSKVQKLELVIEGHKQEMINEKIKFEAREVEYAL